MYLQTGLRLIFPVWLPGVDPGSYGSWVGLVSLRQLEISTLICLAWVGAACQEAQCGMVGPIPRASLDSLEMAGQAMGGGRSGHPQPWGAE